MDRLATPAQVKAAFRRTLVLAYKWMAPCFLLLISAHILAAQQALNHDVLTNEAIVELTKAKVGEDVIIGMIRTLPTRFSLNKDTIIKLKQQGVSDKVLAAMVAKGSSAAPGSVPPSLVLENQPLSTAEKAASSEPVGTWEIRDRKDPMTDEELFDAHLVAKNNQRERIEATATCSSSAGGSLTALSFQSKVPPSESMQFEITYLPKAGQRLARTAMPVSGEVERAPEVFGTPIGNDTVTVKGGGSCLYVRMRVGDAVYPHVYAGDGACGNGNTLRLNFLSYEPKEIFSNLKKSPGGNPRVNSLSNSLFSLMGSYEAAQFTAMRGFDATLKDVLNADKFLVELPLSGGTATVVPLVTEEPSFKKFAARCAADFARLVPPPPSAASAPPKPPPSVFRPGAPAPTTPWGKAMMDPPQFAGTAEEFVAAFPGLLQKAGQEAGFDPRAYDKDSAFVIDSVRSCAQITPAMAAQARKIGLLPVMRSVDERYAVCDNGGSLGMNAQYPDTQIFFQVHAAAGKNWLEGKGFSIFVLFRRANQQAPYPIYPIVYATFPGPH